MLQKPNIGLKIKRLIDLKKETLEEAGKKVGASKANVSRWTRQKDINTKILWKLCEVYGVQMSYFFSESTSYTQKDNTINTAVNAVGEKIINYGNPTQNTVLNEKQDTDFNLLTERLKSCEEKNALLERMIKILEKK